MGRPNNNYKICLIGFEKNIHLIDTKLNAQCKNLFFYHRVFVNGGV